MKLPDGSGLLLTHLFYLLPGGGAIHEKGLRPGSDSVSAASYLSSRTGSVSDRPSY